MTFVFESIMLCNCVAWNLVKVNPGVRRAYVKAVTSFCVTGAFFGRKVSTYTFSQNIRFQ